MNLCTKTFLVWPMRKARSVAWFSTAGFHQRSKCTTCDAAVRFSPAPPALSDSTKKRTASSSWNCRTRSLRFFTSVSPCSTRPGRSKTEPRNAASGAVTSRNWVKTSIFSCRAATTSAISRRRAHLPLSPSPQAPSPSHCEGWLQICNHPSQWLGDGAWGEGDSGKWARLREIAEVVAARQEKMLVFTQFREVTAPLAAFLGSVFERPGLVLHGETEVKKRKDLVRRFQEDEAVRFFVLSLKAGGAGLNLTAASHVVHFDRWWNPAVENQATDRAFRIGQTTNVLVHKFICRGTVEEKIDQLIDSKRHLSQELLEGGAGVLLTELKDDELLKLVALDINRALKED